MAAAAIAASVAAMMKLQVISARLGMVLMVGAGPAIAPEMVTSLPVLLLKER